MCLKYDLMVRRDFLERLAKLYLASWQCICRNVITTGMIIKSARMPLPYKCLANRWEVDEKYVCRNNDDACGDTCSPYTEEGQKLLQRSTQLLAYGKLQWRTCRYQLQFQRQNPFKSRIMYRVYALAMYAQSDKPAWQIQAEICQLARSAC